MFDPLLFKNQFPLFSQAENKDLVYLDNAATTQRPECVIDGITQFYIHSNANTHRSSHRLARSATELVEKTREKAARFLGANKAREIIFTRGATEALNLLAFCLTEHLASGDEILLSQAEHHANLVPWQMAAKRKQLTLRFLPDSQGEIRLSSLSSCINDRTKVIAITAVSNALGMMTELEPLITEAKNRNIITVLDGAQLAAHREVDVKALGCDFFVCAPHKFYGPTGIGLLYGKLEQLEKIPPWQGGGEMIEQVGLQESTYADVPHRFETGTSSLAAVAGLSACFDFLLQQDRKAMEQHEIELVVYGHKSLSQIEEIDLLSQAENNLGIINFSVRPEVGLTVADIATGLDEQDIAVRVGHHCAMPLMSNLGVGPSVRASIAAYNTREDIDALVAGIQNIFRVNEGVDHKPAPSVAALGFGDDLSGLSLEDLMAKKGWQPRYKQLLQWSQKICQKPQIRTAANLVSGCESEAWLEHREDSGRHFFALDSDARIVKGLGVVLLLLLEGKSAEEIAQQDLEAVFQQLGLERHLSESRNNGFKALIDKALSHVNPV